MYKSKARTGKQKLKLKNKSQNTKKQKLSVQSQSLKDLHFLWTTLLLCVLFLRFSFCFCVLALVLCFALPGRRTEVLTLVPHARGRRGLRKVGTIVTALWEKSSRGETVPLNRMCFVLFADDERFVEVHFGHVQNSGRQALYYPSVYFSTVKRHNCI